MCSSTTIDLFIFRKNHLCCCCSAREEEGVVRRRRPDFAWKTISRQADGRSKKIESCCCCCDEDVVVSQNDPIMNLLRLVLHTTHAAPSDGCVGPRGVVVGLSRCVRAIDIRINSTLAFCLGLADEDAACCTATFVRPRLPTANCCQLLLFRNARFLLYRVNNHES